MSLEWVQAVFGSVQALTGLVLGGGGLVGAFASDRSIRKRQEEEEKRNADLAQRVTELERCMGLVNPERVTERLDDTDRTMRDLRLEMDQMQTFQKLDRRELDRKLDSFEELLQRAMAWLTQMRQQQAQHPR